MKNIYLILSVLGFIIPSVLVFIESMETGNILLYTDLKATFNGMFANRISTIFMTDLLYAVMIFFIWSYQESKRHRIKGLYLVWLLTMMFGLAGGFPLFLFLREAKYVDRSSLSKTGFNPMHSD